ncbi:uncharacterized protein LOC132720026 isoform X2 [Ruditapes philippinarum]|uniref:uncharacterized protein LOC132720026 isoform X2 n=1 Tax=Ruditapes philippinarum TaxID=129788 RepID=UPI00295B60D1|nr:uncharacterized protein LOC132720026 isoform X2 [Ruditapes philippinarum]
MWESMPEGKRHADDIHADNNNKRLRLENADAELTGSTPIGPRELKIGSCIYSPSTKSCGTIGPILKIKETGELCFLTVRHIFGPFKSPEKFIGTKVYLKTSVSDEKDVKHCGEVIAAEYDESLDVTLVKISDECLPSKIQLIQVVDEHLTKSGLYSAHTQLSSTDNVVIDARELTSDDIESHILIKVGHASGLTKGKFKEHNGEIKTETHFIRRDEPNFMQVMTYKDQYHIIPVEGEQFATENEVGAAVYLIDNSNHLSCIGIISRIMVKETGVLVTPIQEILHSLGNQLGQTLEVLQINPNLSKAHLEKDDHSLFSRVLKEGQEHDRHVRVNIIGFYAQGKTTLTRRLLNEPFHNTDTTDGIDVHIRRCKIKESNWKRFDIAKESEEISSRLVSVAKTVENGQTCLPVDLSEENNDLDLTTDLNESFANEDENGDKIENSNEGKTKDTADSQVHSTDSRTSVKCLPLFRRFSEDLSENRTIAEDELIATIWDFGGQFVYYATHQIFHSRDAVYLLVFDLRKGLNNILEDYDFPDRQEKMKTSLKFWVNSINAFVGTDDASKPKVILVGTHKDKFTGDVNAKFKEVKDLFAGTDVRKHIYDRTFAVANVDMSDDDDVIDELRKTIYQIGEETAFQKLIPAKWIPLEMALLENRHKHIVTLNDVKEMDSRNDLPIGEEDQIKEFLKYHHGKGTLVFFDEEGLKDHVILSPQFLIDAFKCIITSKTICEGSSQLYQLWKKMKNMAVLEKEIISAVWSKERNTEYFNWSDILLNFLKRHRILAELQSDDNATDLVGMGKYMIPSFLKRYCSKETADSFLSRKSFSSVILGISLDNTTVLNTVYERITAAALGRWPPIKYEEQYLVFENVGFYRLDRQHAGRIMKKKDTGIELMVAILCQSGEKIDVVSDRFRRYVEMVICHEFGKLSNETRENIYSHYIKCNHSDHEADGSNEIHHLNNIRGEVTVPCPDYKDHPINVRKAIEEWFQEKKISASHSTYDRRATEKDLNRIAQAIGTNWELLGIALDLSADKIERIKQRNTGTATKIFHMLKEWRNRNRKNPDLNIIIQAMKDQDAVTVNWDKIRNVFDEF